MSGGWYKQQRNLTERSWFKDAPMVQLYACLKEWAYVTDGRYQGMKIRRGSCPTTRSEMMEATGMGYKLLDKTLKRLISNGEIIVKGNNQFSVITICDYDSYATDETLFGTTTDITTGTTTDTTTDTTHILTKEERINNNLISLNQSYKMERETRDVILEIKKRYNKEFDAVLPPCMRLSTAARLAAAESIRRFGLQAVDIVFDQIRRETFSQGKNKTGFIADFSYIFQPVNFQKYLERAQLRQRKASTAEKQRQQEEVPPPLSPEEKRQQRRESLIELIRGLADNPKAIYRNVVEAARDRGELEELGIDYEEIINNYKKQDES